ncbi:MAG: DUF6273 domain-containing protein [Coriobacteriia bacterium]|nr:DUF6273 domain-containing protein [Coriobacteriia bacterium]
MEQARRLAPVAALAAVALACGMALTTTAVAPNQAWAKADRGVVQKISSPKADTLKVIVGLDFSTQETATKYQVRYSSSKSMAKAKYAAVKAVRISNTQVNMTATISGLKSGRKYYVQARAYRDGWGAWSDATPHVTQYKGKLSSYSWAKVKSIANYIAEAKTRTSALKRARKYGLVGPSLCLSGYERKTVKVGGKSYNVCILDFWADTRTTGKKAGITFAFTKSILKSRMCAGTTSVNAGGWAKSALRAKLNTGTIKALPADLRKCIVTVRKNTNNVGQTLDKASVTATSDKLWVPSCAELSGGGQLTQNLLRWDEPSKAADAVYNAEGPRYSLFTNAGVVTKRYVKATASTKAHYEYTYNFNSIQDLYNVHATGTATPTNARTNVWLRSPRANNDRSFALVRWNGFVYYNGRASDTDMGVAPCFCL